VDARGVAIAGRLVVFVLLAASSAWVAPGRGLRPAMAEPPNDPLAASDV
jgi:hypothetical protein